MPPPQREGSIDQGPLTDTSARVTVKEFRFSGNEGLVTESELQYLVRLHIGKTLSFADLDALVTEITNYLQEKKGFLLARAYLPRQDVTSGSIEIAIQIGKIDGSVAIQLKPSTRIDPLFLQKIANSAVPEGSVVRTKELERAVLLMNDLPGIKANASLERGDTPGTTRVLIQAEEGKLLTGSLSADNFGDRYTGTARGNAQFSLNDPFGHGEQLSVSYTGAEHLNQGSIAATMPIGFSGLSASLSWTGMNYRLGGDFSSLNAKGKSSAFNGGLSYPLLRTRENSIWASINGEVIKLQDEAGGSPTLDRELKVAIAGINGSFMDGFGGGGMTAANLSLTSGDVNLSDLLSAVDAIGPKTAGSFTRATYSLARLQKLTDKLTLFASFRGQLADGNLDSSQKFILGGSSGVRAYPVGEASGDQGNLLTLEGRYDFTPGTQLIGFFDGGCIELHKNVWSGSITNATGRNHYCLSGAGAAINFVQEDSYAIYASLAHVLGSNPGRTRTGQNSDNRDDKTRLWVQATFRF